MGYKSRERYEQAIGKMMAAGIGRVVQTVLPVTPERPTGVIWGELLVALDGAHDTAAVGGHLLMLAALAVEVEGYLTMHVHAGGDHVRIGVAISRLVDELDAGVPTGEFRPAVRP